MAELHAPEGATRRRKRIGRGPGSGHGKTSGKGHKGQKSRAGGGVRRGFEGGQMPLYRRIARRGFSNYPFKRTVVSVNLRELERAFTDGETVNHQTLVEKGIIRRREQHAKILGTGTITHKLTVEGLAVSAGAKAAIEAAGGTVINLDAGEAQAAVERGAESGADAATAQKSESEAEG